MLDYLPLAVSLVVGFAVQSLTGSPRLGQAVGLFTFSATVLATGRLRVQGIGFDGASARMFGVGIGIMGLFRLAVETEMDVALDTVAPDTGSF